MEASLSFLERLGITEEEYNWLDSCITFDEPMEAPPPPTKPIVVEVDCSDVDKDFSERHIRSATPDPVVNNTWDNADALGEFFYVDDEFLKSIDLMDWSAPAPTTMELQESAVCPNGLPQPPPEIHQAVPLTTTDCGRRPQKTKVVRWSKEEHALFLEGLKVHWNGSRGDWKSISREFVKTRSPNQIASHAQKFFDRTKRTDTVTTTWRRRRASVFDMTIDPSHTLH